MANPSPFRPPRKMAAMRSLRLAMLGALVTIASAAAGQEAQPATGSVAAENGVVVHGVDTRALAARFREVDRKALAGDAAGAAADLAVLLAGDVTAMIEEGGGAFLSALEAARQRVAALPPEGLSAYREIVDGRAVAALEAAGTRPDPFALAASAERLALSTHGPRLGVTLADLRLAQGDLRLAAQALEDVLRLWPEGEMPGVQRAAVVSRLAATYAALGDVSSLRALRHETASADLDATGASSTGGTLREEIDRAIAHASARGRGAASIGEGPTAPVRIVAQRIFAPDSFDQALDTGASRDIPEHPIPIGTADRPMLLTREADRHGWIARVVALAPPREPISDTLQTRWSWPSAEELKAQHRPGSRQPFRPSRLGDFVFFPWPSSPSPSSPPSPLPGGFGRRDETGPDSAERHTLLMLSISQEGRVVDERGTDFEARRDDGDLALRTLSFCGEPLVVDRSVYTTLLGRSPKGSATQLHVARFDLVDQGRETRLRLRWRRHVLDGNWLSPVVFAARSVEESESPLALPSGLAERSGRIYVSSNTGAVACLDGTSGRPTWVETYSRFGPTARYTIRESRPSTWKDTGVMVDGPVVRAAPKDAEDLLEFRPVPRRARSTRVRAWRFHGSSGTSSESGPLLLDLVPDEVIGIRDGVAYLSGEVAGLRVAGLVPPGSPLASLRLRADRDGDRRRRYAYAQIPEAAPAGSPCMARDAVLFASSKALYRVPLDRFEDAPKVLFSGSPSVRLGRPEDQFGNLVVDGRRLWSVTPRRVVLFAAE